MNNLPETEYKWIKGELEKIIANKNQFTPEIIKQKIDVAITTIIDIDESLKINKLKKIGYSILKILTFGKIDKNKIIKKKNDFFIEMKNKLNKNIQKINKLYIIKSNPTNIDVNKINNNFNNGSLINAKKSNLLKI
ncbi:hypothetical protein [Spiroplasma endosymbiont of Nebria brevicollis]|uniref:hypothetical protein n=1 Tax=Spiroplasma endosymbiont of Nebria brevicollis TaxID=3066284 RepID=UPI00313CAA36